MFDRVIMKELCRRMLDGWMIHEASWDPETNAYGCSDIDAMTAACGDDKVVGELLFLFSHWSNDIQSVAAVLGVAIIDGKVVDIPPPPSDQHWWHNGAWQAPDGDKWPLPEDKTHLEAMEQLAEETYRDGFGIATGEVQDAVVMRWSDNIARETGSYGDLGVPGDNLFDPSKRGFNPK